MMHIVLLHKQNAASSKRINAPAVQDWNLPEDRPVEVMDIVSLEICLGSGHGCWADLLKGSERVTEKDLVRSSEIFQVGQSDLLVIYEPSCPGTYP